MAGLFKYMTHLTNVFYFIFTPLSSVIMMGVKKLFVRLRLKVSWTAAKLEVKSELVYSTQH